MLINTVLALPLLVAQQAEQPRETRTPVAVDAAAVVEKLARLEALVDDLLEVVAEGGAEAEVVRAGLERTVRHVYQRLEHERSSLSDRIRQQLTEQGWDEPSLRHELADALVNERKYKEALDHYLWCFDHGDDNPRDGYSGVRVSFLLASIVRLGNAYPPALVELRQRRDLAMQSLLDGTATMTAAGDFAAINRDLGEARLTLEVYDQLAEAGVQPGQGIRSTPRRVLFDHVVDLLLESQRYSDIVAGADDPEALFDRSVSHYEHTVSSSVDEHVVAFMKRSAIERGGKYYEALAGTQETDQEAADLAERILAFDSTVNTWVTLIKHADRAGRPELSDSLREEALSTLSEADKEVLIRKTRR